MSPTHLKSLSDDELLRRLSEVLNQSRRTEATLVAHIAEVDARRLYAREGLPSMFQYCVDVLHLSEAEAYRRIAAARISRRYPVILEMLAEGRIHLAGISVLKKHLTDDNYKDLLAMASHKTKEEIEVLVARLAPKPDVQPNIRKRPQRKAELKAKSKPAESSGKLCLGTVGENPPAKPEAPTPQEKRAAVEPLSPARYKVEFTASQELRDKLKRLQALMPGNDLGAVIEAAVSEKLERIEAKRFGKVKKPRKNLDDADTSPGAREIPAPVRRFVWGRDGGQCTFRSADGRRCPERHRLEFHHDDPFGLGGDRSTDNIRLMCRAHNLYRAEKDYGRQMMDAYRRSADRVGEPPPSFGLRPDGARRARLPSVYSCSLTTSMIQMSPLFSRQGE